MNIYERRIYVKNIVLVGYMGCGKTTVGMNLAKICGYTFVDTDEMIELEQKETISNIFATRGEAAFRDMETALLEKMISENRQKLVISTGGGMPVKEVNRKLLNKLGTVVYLKASAETVYNRTKNDTKRPLLQCENPQERINEMLAVRGPIYEDVANVVIEVDLLKQSEIAEKIKEGMVE